MNFFQKDNCDSPNNKNKFYTLTQDKICRRKNEEGLGIRRTEDVNTVFFAKQGWEILAQPDNIKGQYR